VELASLRRLVAGSPGVLAFTVPDVAAQLELTDQQRREFERLTEMTKDALSTLDQRWDLSRAQRAHARELIHQHAREEALAQLSDEQRRRWAELQP
jgi:hypothetical protein